MITIIIFLIMSSFILINLFINTIHLYQLCLCMSYDINIQIIYKIKVYYTFITITITSIILIQFKYFENKLIKNTNIIFIKSLFNFLLLPYYKN